MRESESGQVQKGKTIKVDKSWWGPHQVKEEYLFQYADDVL